VVTDDKTQRLMPHEALGVRDAIKRALLKIGSNEVETRWSVAGPILGDPHWAGGKVFTDQRSVMINADAGSVFAAVCRIGGGNGWYAGDILWRLRGWMDTLVGGPGLRRGRRHSERVEFGEALDFWRVVGIDQNRSLSLLAEMKLPGVAMLNFDLDPDQAADRTKLTMTARYQPKGLIGIMYWYSVVPLHNIVFGGMLKGIRKAAEKSQSRTTVAASQSLADSTSESSTQPGYGRARLWLGISAVGTMVTLATVLLILDVPTQLQPSIDATTGSQIIGLLAFLILYMIVQLPFDFMGGYWLPKRFGRAHSTLGTYLLNLSRGVLIHGSLLFSTAMLVMFAGQTLGVAGTVGAGLLISFLLLQFRVPIASMMATLPLAPSTSPPSTSKAELDIVNVQCDDEGFTGGVVGVLRPRFQILSSKWSEVLGSDGFELAKRRRVIAVQSGCWWRGRAVAMLFTAVGLLLSALLVGSSQLGSATGTIQLSLWFTLWSFLGLLTLPTLSRRGVIEIDERAQAEGYAASLIRQNTERLDRLQDGEPRRPALVETIFHPVPSVENRLEGPRSHQVIGFWDAARTSVYLSLAGIGLLGRAVHCNCGRPALWVFLPTD
jgi:hypothetical protein